MIDVGELARRLSSAMGRSAGAGRGVRMTGKEVLANMGPRGAAHALDGRDARELAELDRLLSTLPRLVVEERLSRRNPGFARYFESLPRIAFLRSCGHSAEEIAERLNFLASDFGVETVLGIVADAISRRLARL